MNRLKILLIFLIAVIAAVNTSGQDKKNEILFVEFNFQNGSPEIVKMEVFPGKLKQPRKKRKINTEYSFEALSKKNNVLYSAAIENPDKLVYEYPSENGEIKRAEISRENKNAIIRLPYCSQLEKIVLYKNSAGPSLKKAVTDKFEFVIKHADIKKD